MSLGPQISVVVPVYNGENYLGNCLGSISAAVERLDPGDRERVEIVVCDNHSGDGSPVVAREARFGCSSRVVQPPQHEENRTRNWAYGLEQATGSWLMMLHHDDLMAAEGLAVQLRHADIADSDGAVMVVGRHRTFADPSAPSRLRPLLMPEGLISGRALRRRVLPFHCPFVPFVLFRGTAFEAVGGLDPRWQLVQDWELWMRLTGEGGVLVHSHEVAWWRDHPTGEGYRIRNAREHVELARGLDRSIPSVSPASKARAEAQAFDHAALQLEGVERPDLRWLEPQRLPSPAAAAPRHRRALRRLAIELTVLRVASAIRRRMGQRRRGPPQR